MKIGGIVLLVGLLASLFIGASYASTTACSDGTAYYACSKTQPGYACLPDSSTGTNRLQNDVAMKVVKDSSGKHKCACANFPGYTELNGECVKTSCTDGGISIDNGACSGTKPNRCTNGQMAPDANACGCPIGMQPKSDNTCEKKVGCRWGTLPCSPTEECKFVEADANDNGKCEGKKGCAFGSPQCTSSQYCDTSSSASGICVTKKGCQYLNPACKTGETCNTISGTCDASGATGSGVPTLPTVQAPTTPNATTSNGLSCCCLPAAGGAAMVGLVSYRRMGRKEEPEE